MVPLTNLKTKSAKIKKVKGGFLLSVADPDASYFKQNVPAVINDLNKKLDTTKPVSEHSYSVLSNAEIGKKSFLGQRLN